MPALKLSGQFDHWAAFIALEVAFVIAYISLVPEETRIKYAASCRNLSVAGCVLLSHSIWIVSLAQFFIAPAEAFISGQLIGAGLIAAGHALVIWAMRANPFFVATITPPEKICARGPYQILMHPGYCGMALAAVGTVLLLSQQWALLPLAIYVAILIFRSRIETRLLARLYSQWWDEIADEIAKEK